MYVDDLVASRAIVSSQNGLNTRRRRIDESLDIHRLQRVPLLLNSLLYLLSSVWLRTELVDASFEQ